MMETKLNRTQVDSGSIYTEMLILNKLQLVLSLFIAYFEFSGVLVLIIL